MKTLKDIKQLAVILVVAFMLAVIPSQAQKQINILDQNISIIAENEPLRDVIQKICDQFNLDYNYNSKLIKGKSVNLNISNKSVKELLDKLMEDFYLIFEINNNILVVRDYVPLTDHIDMQELYNKPSEGFKFDDPRKKAKMIKFNLISNLIVIPVSINGSDTMNFILDTGIKDPIITELTLVEELDLNYMKPIALQGLGKDIETQAYQSGDNTIAIPGLTAKHQLINVVIDENFQISQILGMPVHGLIGFDLFKNYIVKIDYRSEQIRLYNPQQFEYKPRRNDIVMPIHFVRNKPVIRTEIFQDGGTIVPVSLLVDTGASDAIWLSQMSNPKLTLPQNNVFTFLGMGIGGELYGHKGRVDGLWLGGIVMDQPIVSYPQSTFINQIIISEKRNGTIGGEVLRRFTLFFDYYNKRIIFRPNGDLKDEFHYNMSGLEVINPVPGVPVYTISNVMEDSPAGMAGLQKSDQILYIDHKYHEDITLNDINLILRERPDMKVNITVLRNGEIVKTFFRLKEVL